MVLGPDKAELITPDLYRSTHGAEILGTAIGSLAFRGKFLTAKVSKWADCITLLRCLRLQIRQLLFRHSVYPKLTHLTRTLRSEE